MAARAKQDLANIRIETKTVASGQAAVNGQGVIRSGADDFVATAGANANCIGIALHSAAALEKVQIAIPNGDGSIPVKVGTGGATEGAYAISTADGFTDRALGGGTTAQNIVGKFAQSGVAGDFVGLYPAPFVGGA